MSEENRGRAEGPVVMGIDPGKNTGLALYRGGKLKVLKTIAPHEMDETLTWLAPDFVIFEDSRLQSHVWTAEGKSRRAAIKIGRSVGQIDQQCVVIQALCEKRGIPCVGVSPLKKGAKLDAAAFQALTGWDGKTNQHCRDAAMVAWMYRTGYALDGRRA